MHGFQASGANLPASMKMTAPRIPGCHSADYPRVEIDDDGHRRPHHLAGEFLGKARYRRMGIAAEPSYANSVPAGKRRPQGRRLYGSAFAYIFAARPRSAMRQNPSGVLVEK